MTVSVGSCPAERDARLRVGFVGAGKIGFALGTHLFEHGSKVSGYASRTQKAALWASQCTHSVSFSSLQALLDSTDLIFITVPDGAIAETAGQLADAAASTPAGDLSGKLVCHASGALTSGEVDACRKAGAACASVHPLCAVPDVPTSADAPDRLAGMFFTLEGDQAAVDAAGALLDAAGNPHCTIAADAKVRCGFTPEQALQAAGPLFTGNCAAIAQKGPQNALSGPIERNDLETVRKHLAALDGQARETYATLSLSVCELAARRHPERDHAPMRNLLESAQTRR